MSETKLNDSSGYIVLEWKDGNNWRLFQKIKKEGLEKDALTTNYLEEFGRRLLKGKRYRVRAK